MTRSHLVTFSDSQMSRAADLCIGSGQRNGCDTLSRFEHSPFTGSKIYEENEGVFLQSRGLGYWAWKPVIIDWTLSNYKEEYIVYPHGVKNGDIVIYADAGIEFIDNVSHIIDLMDQDIFLFGNNYEHAHWCKRDVIEKVWPYWRDPHNGKFHRTSWTEFGKQVQASVIFFRVSDYTRAFVKEWLDWCLFEGGRLIDDSPSRLPNHPEFQEHRHDQSIITTMAYRDGLKLHWWGARYNMDHPGGGFVYPKAPEFAGDTYEPFVHHHRRRNQEWSNAA